MEQINQGLQENILTTLAHSRISGKLVANLVVPELFDGDFRIVVDRCISYWRQHNQPPGAHVPDLVDDILRGQDAVRARAMRATILNMLSLAPHLNDQYVLAEINKFTRLQSMKAAVLSSAEKINANQDMAIEEVETIWNELLRSRSVSFEPGKRLRDISSVLAYMERRSNEFDIGVPVLTKRGIVPARGAVFLFIAAPKVGKCVVEGEPVLLSNGEYLPIEQLPNEVLVPALNQRTFQFENKRAWLSENGIKPAYKITTRTGREVRLTANHPLLTRGGWTEVKNLCLEDAVAVPMEVPVFGNKIDDMKAMRMLGYLIADGGLTAPSSPTFSKQDPEIVADMNACLETFGCILTRTDREHNYWVINKRGRGYENLVVSFLRECGLLGKKSNQKTIPERIFQLRKELIAEFLSALFTCDGSVFERSTTFGFEYSTTSEALAQQVCHLLTRFGIVFTLRCKRSIVAEEPYYSWPISVSSVQQLEIFRNDIGLKFSKGRKLDQFLQLHTHKKSGMWAKDRVGQVFFDQITKIEYIGERQTYDLSVEDHHNFIVNGIVVHNSWFCVHVGRKNIVKQHKVLHISLEMSEEQVLQRYYQNLFSVPRRYDEVKLTTFTQDDQDQISGWDYATVKPDFGLDSPVLRDELESRSDTMEKLDNLLVKRFAPRTLSINGLIAYLDGLEINEKFIPDLLILDSPYLMKMDDKDYRIALGRNLEQVRAIAVERNLAIVATHQLSRPKSKKSQKDSSVSNRIAEDWTQVQTADTVVSFQRTDMERTFNLGRLYVEHCRDEEDRFGLIMTQNLSIGQWHLASYLLPDNYWELVDPKKDEPAK